MARTPLMSRLQDAAAEAAPTRRQFLAAGALAAAAAATPRWMPMANAATAPRIAVVGAGLAGLTATYRLKRSGYAATLYEASDRLGGRCWSIRGAFAGGQVAEHGGELIDQRHTAIRQLAQELGLKLDNLLSAEVNGTEPFYVFDREPYSYAEATDDLKGIWQQIHKDLSAASYPTLYDGTSTPRGRELDQMSIRDWIDAYVPGGIGSKLGQLLDIAYTIEYGAETTDQSSLNMLYLLGYSGQGQLRIFGPSNEKYHVAGGNDQITDGMAARIGAAQIRRGHELVAVRENADGSYTLSFAGRPAVTADKVVLALPFSILRSSVDISRAGFKALKRIAIAEQGMGTNSKLNVGFTDRHWNALGCNGDTTADTGYQNTWEVSRAQPGRAGILVDYTGGDVGASFGSGTALSRAKTFLGQLEPVLPGITKAFAGTATLDFWPGYRWTKGSYSYWKVGQYTRFAGVEREVEGRLGACHFAGEHTSIDFQGYLQGAVETGGRAADEILSDLR
jgi:monoamine oxidase